MTAVSVKTLSLYLFDIFLTQRTTIYVVLKYAIEGYIKYFKINIVGINLEARVYRSQCKREKSHITEVTIADEKNLDQHGSCTSG